MNTQIYSFTYMGTGERLDKYLVVCLPNLSRSRIQGLIADGLVVVNGRTAAKSGVPLENGMAIEVTIPAPSPVDITPEAIPLAIVFENDDLMVINKPAGMVVHPAAGHSQGTLVNAALAHAPDMEGISGEIRPGVVHRLDKDTSGLIMMAKNDRTQQWLQDQFRLRTVKKVYLALVDGAPPTPKGRVEAAIGRDSSHRKKMAIVSENKGRAAVSEYSTMEAFSEHTLLEVQPHTGRTHQIRLHMAFLGCPISGDTLYGQRHSTIPLKRHFLHAWRLNVLIPGEKQPRQFEANLPDELQAVLVQLRSRNLI
jgi:23S rRNA pseudouridine1911/1915/1917 synthase